MGAVEHHCICCPICKVEANSQPCGQFDRPCLMQETTMQHCAQRALDHDSQHITEMLQVWMQGSESPVVVMFSGLAGLVSPLFDLASKLLLPVVYPLLTALKPSCHSREVLTERERLMRASSM